MITSVFICKNLLNLKAHLDILPHWLSESQRKKLHLKIAKLEVRGVKLCDCHYRVRSHNLIFEIKIVDFSVDTIFG